MTQVENLAAKARESVGKGTARALRRNEEVPAVIYGDKIAPLGISLLFKDLVLYVNKASFFTTLFDIDVDGKKHRVLPRDVQFHPVTDRPLHVDFLRVSPKTKVRVKIPVHFTNMDKCPGLKRGGTLNIVHHEIEALCIPGNIPDGFTIDLSPYALGEAVHLSAITVPKDVELTSKEADYTIAAVAVPSALRGSADEAETTAAAAAPADAAAKPAAGGAKPAAGAAKPAAAPAKPAAKK